MAGRAAGGRAAALAGGERRALRGGGLPRRRGSGHSRGDRAEPAGAPGEGGRGVRCVKLKGVEFERHFGERAPKGTSLEPDLEKFFLELRDSFSPLRVGGGGRREGSERLLAGERESEVKKVRGQELRGTCLRGRGVLGSSLGVVCGGVGGGETCGRRGPVGGGRGSAGRVAGGAGTAGEGGPAGPRAPGEEGSDLTGRARELPRRRRREGGGGGGEIWERAGRLAGRAAGPGGGAGARAGRGRPRRSRRPAGSSGPARPGPDAALAARPLGREGIRGIRFV